MLRVDEEDDPASSDRVGLAGVLVGDPVEPDPHRDAVRSAVREHGSDAGAVRAFPRARTASGGWVTVLSSG
jgi:hypothetical protein